MKAKELMIGDWVNLSKGNWSENRQVELIDIEMIAESVYLAEPIPLTPNILEKNGFEVTRNMSSSGNKDVWSWRVSKNKVFHIIEHHNKMKFPYFWIELGSNSDIKYVHQLQHALRLCGIEKEIIL